MTLVYWCRYTCVLKQKSTGRKVSGEIEWMDCSNEMCPNDEDFKELEEKLKEEFLEKYGIDGYDLPDDAEYNWSLLEGKEWMD